jgi:plastocyanin
MNDRIKRVTGIAVGAVALGVLTGPPVVAAITTQVDVNDGKFFSPKAVSTSVGDSVHWAASGVDDHSVTQDDLVFDTGTARAGITLTKTFSAGTYPYHCKKHGVNGGTMKGTVTVAPQVATAPAGLAFTVKWAAVGTDTGTSFDVKYRVASGAWKTWRTNTTAKSMVFGKGGPVAVARGKTYSFQVRSGTGANESLFSPIKSFRAS